MSNWKQVGAGVLMWAPNAEMGVDATSRAFSWMSDEVHEVEAPTCGKDDVLEIIFQDLLGTSEELHTTPRKRRSALTPRSSLNNTSVTRDQVFSTPIAREASPSCSLSSTCTLYEHTDDISYASDRTDFLETEDTPCPKKGRGRPRIRQTGITSHFFQGPKAGMNAQPIRRKLDFGKTSSTKLSRAEKQPRSMISALEQSPRQSWTSEARQLLLVFYRWYITQDRSALNIIFNHVLGWNMKDATIVAQFADMKADGSKACWEWELVFDTVSFDDPMGQFTGYRKMIESAAKELDVELAARQEEHDFQPGSAAKRKSLYARRKYRSRVRALALAKKVQARSLPLIEKGPSPRPPLGGHLVMEDAQFEATEFIVDTEDDTMSAPERPRHIQLRPQNTPKLGFRVWDEFSASSFVDGRFVAGVFVGVAAKSGGQIPPPFNPETEDGRRAIKVTCSGHFNNIGGPSAWISVHTSLLESLTKSACMSKPRFSLVDLTASLEEKHRTLKAHEVIRDLKKEGFAYWARTKHWAELLIFGELPRESIIREFSLHELIELAEANVGVADMLQLNEFQAGRKTSAVATQLCAKEIKLDTTTAKAMAVVCNKFGLVKLEHIQDCIARLIDGWGITYSSSTDIGHIGRDFAMALASITHSDEEVAQVFFEGAHQGTEVLRFWNSRHRPRARKIRIV